MAEDAYETGSVGGSMETKERATVMIRRRGNHEDRLRQAMVDGLVRKEVQQDIEATLTEAAEARRYAEHMEAQAQVAKAQVEAARVRVGELDWQLKEAQRTAKWQAEKYGEAVRAYEQAKKRKDMNRKRRDAAVFLITVFLFLVAANILGRWIFGLLSR